MRVDLEIGTIGIDVLPEGISVEELRAAFVGAFEAQLNRRSGGPERAESQDTSVGTAAAHDGTSLAEDVSQAIHRSLRR